MKKLILFIAISLSSVYGIKQYNGFYHAKFIYNYDGDTIDLDVDLGFEIRTVQRIRLLGCDTYEIRSKNEHEKVLAKAARDHVKKVLSIYPILLQTDYKKGKYGRYLGNIFYKKNGRYVELSKELIALKLTTGKWEN